MNIKEEKKEVKICILGDQGALPLLNIFPPLTLRDVSQTIRAGHSDVARKWERINLDDVFNIKMFHFDSFCSRVTVKKDCH